jgi:integrase
MPLNLFRRGRVFYLRGSVAGQRVYESTGLGERKAAEILRARREAELIERAAYGRKATATFAEAALTYMESGGEARYLAPILAHFGPRKRVADVDMDAVNACARALLPDAAPATINRQIVTPISAVVNMAADSGLCPPRRFRRRPVDNARLRWLTPEEAERLIRAAEPRVARMILFLLGTGCRTGEMFALRRADLHIEQRQAWIADAKNGEARMVRFPGRVQRALVGHLPDAGAVFRTPKGAAYLLKDSRGGQMQAAFNAARDAAGLGPEVTPHVLRHTWATWYYAATHDFGGLMDLGGWRKADMANRYRKIAPDDLPARLARHGWALGGAKAVQAEPAQQASASELIGISGGKR